MKKLLFFLISSFLFLFLQSCTEKISDTSNHEHKVPFLTRTYDKLTCQYNFYKGFWDLEKGKLSFGNEQAIEVKGENFDVRWDGNMNIIVESIDNKNIAANCFEPGLNIKKVNSGYQCIEASLIDNNNKIYRITNHTNQITQNYIFEIEMDGVKESIPIKPSFEKEYMVVRPLALHIKNDRAELYLELSFVPDENKPWEHGYAIVKGIYSGTNGIEWRIVSRDIGIGEAGAGVSMIEYNENVIIADQYGRLKLLNLEDGTVEELETLNEKIEQFHKKYVHRTEFQKPPELYRYKDFLIVKDAPAVPDSQPVVYILAVREGRAIGEIIAQGNKVTVFKDGIVTEKRSLDGRHQPFAWIFPEG